VLGRPDILVLGAGGILGEAWMLGVLAGVEDASGFDLSSCEYFLGTSAGAIVAARLAAGESLERPRSGRGKLERGETPSNSSGVFPGLAAARRAGEWAIALSAPLASITLEVTEPGGRLARALVLRAIPTSTESLGDLHHTVDSYGARFDGRLRIVAVERGAGRRVVFGRPGAPAASVAEAVEASCAIPWMFAPVRIGGHDYVDGAVWSPTNLDAAPAGRGTQVLCLNPTAGMSGPDPLFALVRGTSRSITLLESQVLRSRGADTKIVGPDRQSIAALGSDLMARTRRPRVVNAGYAQGLALAGGTRDPPEAPV
jgi:NTE family protein